MNTLLLLLLFIFGGVALMVVLGERFAKPMEPEQAQKLSRWVYPLAAVAIILTMINYFF
jgi:hypothetical protein